MNRTNFILAALFFLIILVNFSVISAEGENNLTAEQQAQTCLQESDRTMKEMFEAGFFVHRINDSLREAENLFDAQTILMSQKRRYNFSLILPYCNNIESVKEKAFLARDEFDALNKFYREFLSEEMNTSSIDKTLSEINEEMKSERYEQVNPLVERGYKEITSIKSSQTALNLFYKSTARGVRVFFVNNWKFLFFIFILLLSFFLVYKNAIEKWRINRKIKNLERKKQILHQLIQKVQKDYFEKGVLSQNEYTIKTKKFAELIRDIDRELPALKEEFVKVERKISVLKEKKDDDEKRIGKKKERKKKK